MFQAQISARLCALSHPETIDRSGSRHAPGAPLNRQKMQAGLDVRHPAVSWNFNPALLKAALQK
jgi:hypothetical protein